MSEPRIILFDLETLPNLNEAMKEFPSLGNYPGLTLKATINSIICFGYKVLGEKTKCLNAWDYPAWLSDVNDDFDLVKRAREILADADAVVTFNGKKFDWKFLQTRLMLHGLPPLPKIDHVDCCSLSKKHLYFFNNRLKTVAKFITEKEKIDTGGWDLWVRVSKREPKAMREMSTYCKGDVDALEGIFKKMRPLITQLPNYNLFRAHEKDCCHNCGSTRLHSEGWRHTKTKSYRRLTCKDCHTQMRLNSKEKEPRVI